MNIFSVLARLCILCGYGIYSFRFDRDTEKILCTNQCNAFCLESQYSCSIDFLECSTGNESTKSYWMANCDIPHCIGTCNTLREHFDYSRAPEIPEVTLNDVTGTHVDLSWPPSNSVFIVYYVVQMREMGNSSWTTVISKARLTRFKISVPDPCGQYDFRVMAINEYGSKGFSSHVRVSKFVPGPVPNITYAEQGMHYKPGQSAFMGIIQWSNIPGWTDSDIQSYYWNPNPQRNCKSLYQSVQPLFRDASQGKNQVLMEFDEDAFGCSYETQVRAISRCGVTGIWTNFTVDLSDCRFLHKFPCQLYPHEFSPPGKVQNVSIGADRGGRKVMIKLQWLPPDDLGSMGMVDHYFIRWGQVQIIRGINLPSFTSEPNITKVPWDTVEFYVQVERNVHADYGFQIIPVAPNHPLSDNEWGLFTIHVIEVSPAGKSHSNRLGTVLLDDSEVRVMKINNTVDVSWTIVQSRDLRRNKSMFYDRYAVQWGKVEPGKTSNDSRLVAEKNSTIVPSSNAKLTIPLNKTGIFYGIQIKGLKENDTVEEEVWDTVPLHIFQIPDPGGGNSSGSSHTEYLQPDDDSKVLQILLPILSVILLVSIIVTAKYKCRNQWKKFYYLEERREMPGGISNDYNNVHRGSIFSLHPVEPDRWEVPHSSVKVGKILGCGAFGQVVKGRISKSVLLHRGVHIPNGTRTGSTYVSVAVKMLQEEALDSYKEDFLREINLMKTIGFHPHVVNMLGCCTLNDPICLIVEHVPYGDMLSHLKKIRQKIQHRDSTDGHYVNRDIDILSPIDLLSFARQIAIGMEFLSQKGFVHRDLAARNILVGYNKTVKIGDFGLTRYIYNDSIYINRKGGRLPLKWMSIEAIFELTFSTASDVWSFGVVLFEIVTLGGTPYPTLDPRDLLKELKQGYRMEKPDNCSDQLYQVMLQCWEELPDKRPSFTNLRDILDDMLEETSGVEYLHFRLDDNKNYYHVETEDSAENENIEMDDADSCDMTADDRFENETSESAIENIANGQVKRTRFSDVTIYISDEYETDTEDEILGGGEEESDSILSDKSSDNVEKDTGLRDNDHNDVPLDKDEKAERENCLACSLSNDSNVKDYFVSDNHAENRDLTRSSEDRIPRRNSSSGSLCISNSHCIDKEMDNNSEGSDESTISDMIASDSPKACESIDTCVKDRSLVLRTSSSSSGYDDDVFVDDDKTLPLVCQRFPKISNLPFYFRRGYAPDSLGYGSGSSHTSSDVDSNQSQSLV